MIEPTARWWFIAVQMRLEFRHLNIKVGNIYDMFHLDFILANEIRIIIWGALATHDPCYKF